MTSVAEAFVTLRPDHKGFEGEAKKGILGPMKGLALAVGGAFAAAGVGSFLKGAIEEAREAARVTRLTEQVIKSTGGVAHISAGQIGELAEHLSAKVGIDDELIQSGENVLATFTNVRNEVGKGNDIFSQATGLALDMSTALGTDMQGSVIQLGKALNDPIKGITALSRVGVSFTAQQKDQIKAMVAAGDTLGAQKLILGELSTEFGGAAEAAADPMQKLGVVTDNLKEKVGTALLPVISSAATWLGEHLPGALDAAGDAIGPLIDKARQIFDVLFHGDFTGGPFSEDSPFIANLFDFREVMVEQVIPAVRDVVSWIGDHLKPILIGLGAAALLAVGPIAAVAAGLVYAYTQSETFRSIVQAAVSWLTDVAAPAIGEFASYIGDQFSNLVTWTQEHWAAIQEAVDHVLTVVRTIIETTLGVIAAFWRQWGDDLSHAAEAVFDGIKETIEHTIDVIRGVIQTALDLINGDWGDAWDDIKEIVSTVWEQIQTVIDTAIELVKSSLGGMLSSIFDVFTWQWGAIKGVVSTGLDAIVGFVTDLPGRVTSAVATAFDAVKDRAGEAVSGALGFFTALPGQILGAIPLIAAAALSVGSTIIDKIGEGLSNIAGFAADLGSAVADAVRGAINTIIDLLNDAIPNSIGWGPASIDLPNDPIPHLPHFGLGGIVPGPLGAPTLAVVHGGETVLPTHRFGFGAGVHIENFHAHDGVDVELLGRKLAFAGAF